VKILVIDGQRAATEDVVKRLCPAKNEIITGGGRDNARSLIRAHDPHLLITVAVPLQPWHTNLLTDLLTWEHTPYSIAVSSSDNAQMAELLRAGADAVAAYPLSPEVFEAQIVAIERRATAPREEAPIPEIVTVRDLVIDNARYQASFAGQRLAVTPAEFRILSSLARRPGKVVPTDTLSVEALGHAEGGQAARDTLKVHVRRIRNKIREAGGSADYIWNIRGVGYMLERRAPGQPGRRPEGGTTEED
jgi:DNA-binding response OmpR family regulator